MIFLDISESSDTLLSYDYVHNIAETDTERTGREGEKKICEMTENIKEFLHIVENRCTSNFVRVFHTCVRARVRINKNYLYILNANIEHGIWNRAAIGKDFNSELELTTVQSVLKIHKVPHVNLPQMTCAYLA